MGQDYGQKERLKHFLIQLRTQGKTVVIVTHDVEFVAESQPRIVLMAQGKIVADGPAKKIMTDAKDLETCSVAPPEVTKLFSKLIELRLPRGRPRRRRGTRPHNQKDEGGIGMSLLEGLRFTKGDSPLHRMDPRVKFLMTMVIFTLSILFLDLDPPRSSSSPYRYPSSSTVRSGGSG